MLRNRSHKGYEFLEHTADIYIAAYGRNLEEAFANAARAMFDSMTDLEKIEPKERRDIVVEGMDLEQLLYNWLQRFQS